MKKIFQINPLTTAILTVVFLILLGYMFSDSGVKMIMDFRLIFIGLPILFILIRGFDDFVGITRKVNEWHSYWWLLSIPFLSVIFLNLSSVSFSKIVIEFDKLPALLFDNFMVGCIEEIWLRGILFYFLYKMWGKTRAGLIGACIVQALFFGIIHLMNLGSEPLALVGFQVFYATAIGFGFGALMLITRSIWPSIIIHSFIDFVSAIEENFNPFYVPSTEFTTNQMLLVSSILFITFVLFSFIYLFKIPLSKSKT